MEKNVGENLKKWREAKGYTWDTLAERVGCSRNTIGNLEARKTVGRARTSYRLCAEALGINYEQLIQGTPAGSPLGPLADFERWFLSLPSKDQLYVFDRIRLLIRPQDAGPFGLSDGGPGISAGEDQTPPSSTPRIGRTGGSGSPGPAA